jgi:hypothetical protein
MELSKLFGCGQGPLLTAIGHALMERDALEIISSWPTYEINPAVQSEPRHYYSV